MGVILKKLKDANHYNQSASIIDSMAGKGSGIEATHSSWKDWKCSPFILLKMTIDTRQVDREGFTIQGKSWEQMSILQHYGGNSRPFSQR